MTAPPDILGIKVKFRNPDGSVGNISLLPEGRIHEFSVPEKRGWVGPHHDTLELPRRDQALAASGGLTRAMRVLAGGAGSIATGATAVFKAFKGHPAISTTLALIAGQMMQRLGMPNLPAGLLAQAAGMLGSHVRDMALQGGNQALGALGSMVTPENVAGVGAGAVSVVAARNPEATRRTVKDLMTSLAAIGLTLLAAVQTRLNRPT